MISLYKFSYDESILTDNEAYALYTKETHNFTDSLTMDGIAYLKFTCPKCKASYYVPGSSYVTSVRCHDTTLIKSKEIVFMRQILYEIDNVIFKESDLEYVENYMTLMSLTG